MHLEFKCEQDGVCIKQISIFTERTKTYVQVTELREDRSTGKAGWLPMHFKEHIEFETARIEFMGLVCGTAYEHANNTLNTDRENIFIRGSLPTAINRRGVW